MRKFSGFGALVIAGDGGGRGTELTRLSKIGQFVRVTGFIEPTAGRILIDGVDMAGVPPAHRPTATVFQTMPCSRI